jgi:hypothetical protein
MSNRTLARRTDNPVRRYDRSFNPVRRYGLTGMTVRPTDRPTASPTVKFGKIGERKGALWNLPAPAGDSDWMHLV